MARAVAPGIPHHVTQRGNRRQQTFFNDEDYQSYLELMSEWCEKYKVEIWAYCLMPNHVHLIAVPESKDGLNWIRKDNEVGITVSNEGWDSEAICYPYVFDYNERRYMLYNGNNYGKTGFGLAVLTSS